MKQLIKKFLSYRNSYISLVKVKINKNKLLHNLNYYQSLNKDIKIAPVLKSNAYGHGLEQIALILDKQNLPFFVVDTYFEALFLRRKGIKTPILIIGYTFTENILNNKLNDLAFTIINIEQFKELSKNLRKPTNFHIKIDTGMHRQGIYPDQINDVDKAINGNSKINIQGVCTHLSNANNLESDVTKKQINLWIEVVPKIKRILPYIRYFHFQNTAGLAISKNDLSQDYPGFYANVGRLGIGLYGLSGPKDLKPVLSMTTIITSIKDLKSGDTVGYNNTYKCEKDMKIATIPVGYYEGIDFSLSDKGIVNINKNDMTYKCPIIGLVSMNITIIDISKVPGVNINDQVEVISSNNNDGNSVEKISKLCNTIPYVILVKIPSNLKRIIA